MCAEAFNPDDDEEDSEPRVVHPKTDEQRCRLQEACKDILLFKALDQVRTLTHTHRYEGYKTVNRRHPGCITPGLCAGQSVRFGLYVRLITRALLKLPLSIHHVRGTYCLFNVLLLELICIVYFLLMSCSTSKLCSVDINVLWSIWRLTRACNRVSKMGIFALLWICNTCR